MISKTQIDRLGERLKSNSPSAEDLRQLDQYRRSFRTADEVVMAALTDRLKLEPTGREAKTTNAIVAKLRRESIRLWRVREREAHPRALPVE